MKLYYIAGACSLSPYIALREAGQAFELVLVTVKGPKLPDGSGYKAVQPLGYVPLLELDDGTRLSEGPAIVQYIADLVPAKNLAPANGTMARYQLQSWLGYISTELHKGFAPLFIAAMPEDVKQILRNKLASSLQWVDGELAGTQYLMGYTFTVADIYLFAVTMPYRARRAGIDLSPYIHLLEFRERVAVRPTVQEAIRVEGPHLLTSRQQSAAPS